jgi:hypothetical protein
MQPGGAAFQLTQILFVSNNYEAFGRINYNTAHKGYHLHD